MKSQRGVLIVLLFLLASLSRVSAQNIQPTNFSKITTANVNQLAELSAFTPNRGIAPNGIRFTDDHTVMLVGWDGSVRSWNVADFPGRVIANVENAVNAIFEPGGKQVICACSNLSPVTYVQRVDFASGKTTFLTDFGPVSNLALDSQGKQLAIVGGWSQDVSRVEIWDLTHNVKTLTITYGLWTFNAEFDPADDHVLAVGFIYRGEVWNIQSATKLFTFEQTYPISPVGGEDLPVASTAFSPNGSILASSSSEGFIWLWDVKTGKNLRMLSDPSIHFDICGCSFSSYSKLTFSPSGNLLVAADGQELRFWDVATGRLLRTINQPVDDLAFNASGTLLTTVDGNGTLKIWSVA